MKEIFLLADWLQETGNKLWQIASKVSNYNKRKSCMIKGLGFDELMLIWLLLPFEAIKFEEIYIAARMVLDEKNSEYIVCKILIFRMKSNIYILVIVS